jgi:hypothetical protein
MLLGPRYAAGAIVTQVVPAVNSHATIVLNYKEALAKYFPGESAEITFPSRVISTPAFSPRLPSGSAAT